LRRDVSVELGSLQQVLVTGERDALKQMLLNIIDNALTYTPTRGKVEVEMRETTVLPAELAEKQGDAQARWAVISIRDTGPGIAPADVPHIFERHYRAERTRARGTLGAGIGLALARLIARAHHGDITVESELMKGSCFHIWLPLSPAWEEQPAQAD
ncbi:MAG TPA: sensor histidine kinase, partial [Ktedonobacteraceae bacterium]|nr:sensor histidine kinase [Ktedonobacteraceae bacterium]